MRRHTILTAGAMQLIACTRRPPGPGQPTAPPPAQHAPDASELTAAQTPAPAAFVSPIAPSERVSDERFARRVLYTWTSREQADALRRTPVLLTRTESAVHGASYFDQTVQSRADRGESVAAILQRPEFRRARFAWSNPWATVRGWAGEQYGHSLLRVTLKEEAYVLRVHTGSYQYTLHDMNDRELPLSELEAHPMRLGAVYFVHDVLRSPNDPAGTMLSQGGAPYREYVLCNEHMVERWELGTDAVQQAITDGAALATALADALRVRAPVRDWPRESTPRWRQAAADETLVDAYLAAIAFLNDRYLPTAENLDAVAAELRGVARDLPPLEHVVTTVPPPPRAPTPRPTPRPPVRNGTY